MKIWAATDPNGQQCTSLASNGYCPGDGPSPTAPPTSSGPTQLAVGQPLMVSQGGGTTTAATVTVTKVTVTTQPADPSFGSPPQNGYYIIATVTVTASQDGFDINTLDFYCLTHGHHYDEGNGNAFQAVSNPADITGTLNSGRQQRVRKYLTCPIRMARSSMRRISRAGRWLTGRTDEGSPFRRDFPGRDYRMR